ncbi:hypothetical protein HPG69_013803 [Diceros bicornis minor]|uniref:Uncharacterized protein n=1 Tax=Diceros bicornis minor TaxID=77932 RepID=A0A7J7FIT6_DICBM|nr:hypothetical protein HPG69_013803 [Diceros bicornis minor]
MLRYRKTNTQRVSRRRPGRAGAALLFVGACEGRRYGRSQDRGCPEVTRLDSSPELGSSPARTVVDGVGQALRSTPDWSACPGVGRAGRCAEAAQGLPSGPRRGA